MKIRLIVIAVSKFLFLSSQVNFNIDSTFKINYWQENTLNKTTKQIFQTLKDYHIKPRTYEGLASTWHSKYYDSYKLPEQIFYSSAFQLIANRKIVPYLLAIDSIDNYYKAEVTYLDVNKNKGTFNNIFFNHQFYFQKDFDGAYRIVPKLEIINTKKIIIKNIEFNLVNNAIFSEKEMNSIVNFGDSLATFFNIDVIPFKAYYANTLIECYDIIGFNYYPNMFKYPINKYSGFSELINKRYFSTPQLRISKHELTHLYLFEKFGNIHYIVKEGLPTFLIGTWETLEEILKKIKIDLLKHQDYNFNNLMDFRYTDAAYGTNYLYGLGALICKLTYDKNGKTGLFELLASGATDDDLCKAIEKQLGVKRENLNEFLRTEINKY